MELAIAVVGLITALVVLGVSLRTKATVNQVHVLTNSRLTEVLDRVTQLTEALEASGVDVPDAPDRIV